MKVKATLIDCIHRFICGPQPGDVYQQRKPSYVNPFNDWKPSIVEIVEFRDLWVQFSYQFPDGGFAGNTTEWELRNFVYSFKLIEKEEK